MRVEHQLKYQIRCIACFAPPLTGVVIGSIEGRCSVNHLTPQSGKSFPFKCHRNPDNPDRSRSSEPVDVYPVNEIAVHPQRQTIATVGGDGYVNFWDTGAQLRLSHVQPRTRPTFLTSCSFSVDGAVLAVADSYDWSHGHDATLVNRPSKVLLYKVQSRDIHKT
jgi:WD40 repeat protein